MCCLGTRSGPGKVYICGNATNTANPLQRGRASEQGPHLEQGTMAMKNIFQTILQWQRRSFTARILNRLDDHMLDDIGVTRADLSKDIHIFH